MIFYYIVRDVKPGADCSYPAGRTLIANEVKRTQGDGERRAEQFNRFCHVTGVNYVCVPHRDDTAFKADHYEQPQPIQYERITIEG